MIGTSVLLVGDNPSLSVSISRWAAEHEIPFDNVQRSLGVVRLSPGSVVVWAAEDERAVLPVDVCKLAGKHRLLACVPHTAHTLARRALDAGFDNYLCIPTEEPVIFDCLERLMAEAAPPPARAAEISDAELDTQGYELRGSKAGRAILDAVAKVAPYPTTVLLLGESGTGKGIVAKLIHEQSVRKKGPFVPVHLASMNRDLIESEMFGHVKGAFTGATQGRQGAFALADGGTLFIDEVGEVPLDIQAKILRALQDREYYPVGSDKLVKLDCRVIAATNRDLVSDVKQGRFRQDLYYRLSVYPITLAPLRERMEGLDDLVRVLLRRINEKLGTSITEVSEGAFALLRGHPWPGNIRELENTLERAAIERGSGAIQPADVRLESGSIPQEADSIAQMTIHRRDLGESFQLDDVLHRFEAAILQKTLEIAGGNLSQTARLLGIPRSTLQHRLAKYVFSDADPGEEEPS